MDVRSDNFDTVNAALSDIYHVHDVWVLQY